MVKLPLMAICILLSICLPYHGAFADELGELMDRVASLDISRNGYTLGKTLTEKQMATAQRNSVKHATPGTFKFKDKNLYVVLEKTTHRIIILYEQYKDATAEQVRDLVGSLYLDFGDPTLMAHDKIIYWAFGAKGKLSKKEYQRDKHIKKKLNIFATVKLNSDINILGKRDKTEAGDIYFIISSEPVLKAYSKIIPQIKNRGSK
jgi:hypothetical protein